MSYDLLYPAPSHLRLGDIYERRGDRAKATEHYTQVISLLRKCDPELEPVVLAARQALTRFR